MWLWLLLLRVVLGMYANVNVCSYNMDDEWALGLRFFFISTYNCGYLDGGNRVNIFCWHLVMGLVHTNDRAAFSEAWAENLI